MTGGKGPLAGIRVLDMTTVLLGPYATQLMAEMGAEVIKLEAPEGDVIRLIGPMRNRGMGCMYLTLNRGKRSLCLDLKREEGRAAAREVARGCDVVVTNIRPAAMKRLGMDAASLRAAHPRLVYAAIVGFGQAGPYGKLPAYDDLIQGLAALPHLTQRQGSDTPRYTPLALADRVTGLHTLTAVLAALVERGRTGVGQEVEVPMFEVMASLVLGDHLTGLTYDPPLDEGGYPRLLSPDRRPYATRDGYLCAMIYNDAQWRRFFAAIGEPERFERDPRMASHTTRTQHIDAIYAELGEILATRTTAEWLEVLGQADVPCAPAHTLESLRADPHLNAVGFFQEEEHPTEGKLVRMAAPVRFSAHGDIPRAPTRRLGEDGPDILREAGLDAAHIAALAESGAMVMPR
ncbi:CaiB/BaiF CoA transferase family protein [Roseococcus suduntuyensis]|uniref:Crotonobetainyl-CoA:carnitine CoA-transferase CaiB-like acyl-CoA transferase n=1 Tax=Roseococcus suduntuyensis TaxID=455361 RepID=A0A840AC18_9PROT|nr:CoA transferase [Roseococcus suduntuyensis]MBB3898076.1 crotonobetainyl-CoA:carnitine CoA-transferase CaiB-like acyl-CoA transferase [Roseococcus suduntuyensis]